VTAMTRVSNAMAAALLAPMLAAWWYLADHRPQPQPAEPNPQRSS
jgi:hypothetical protein